MTDPTTPQTPEELKKLAEALGDLRPTTSSHEAGLAAAMAAFDAEFSPETEKNTSAAQGSAVGARPTQQKDHPNVRVRTVARDSLMTRFNAWMTKPQTKMMGGSAVALLLAGVVFVNADIFGPTPLPGDLPRLAEPVVESDEPDLMTADVKTPDIIKLEPVAPVEIVPEDPTNPKTGPALKDPTETPTSPAVATDMPEAGPGYTDIVVERKVLKAPARTVERNIPAPTTTVEREVMTEDGTFETITETIVIQEASTELVVVPPVYETVRETLRVRADGSSEVIASDAPVIKAPSSGGSLSSVDELLGEIATGADSAGDRVREREFRVPSMRDETSEPLSAPTMAPPPPMIERSASEGFKISGGTDDIVVTASRRGSAERGRAVAAMPAPTLDIRGDILADDVEAEAFETRTVAAVTEQVSRRIIKTPARTTERVIPAITKDITVDIVNPDGTTTQVTQTVVVQDAQVELVTIPPRYETVMETVVIRPAYTEIIERDVDGNIISTRPMPTPKPKPKPTPRPEAGLLTAGDYDDVLNPELYKTYLDKMLQGPLKNRDLPYVDANRRIGIEIVDRKGQPLPLAKVTVEGSQTTVTTGANGMAYFYPSFDQLSGEVKLRIDAPGSRTIRQTLTRSQVRNGETLEVRMRTTAKPIDKLDLLLTLDATGSMGDEMRYLQTELRAILDRVEAAHPGIDIRTGLIVYRDEGDDYVVREIPFTDDEQTFRRQLSAQKANGGGDMPEAMHTAMETGLDMDWRDDALKINLLVADAPPHQDKVDRTWAAGEASRAKGIHIVPLAASGVDKSAEFLMRSMAQLTGGRFLFLTDDSGIGNPHAKPTVDCYIVTKLDGLVTRVLSSLIAGERVEPRPGQVIRSVGDYNGGVCEVEALEGFIINASGQR